jgi:formylglycine-generating enzyme required for sulfatase activity
MTAIPSGQFLMGSSDEDIKRDIEEVPDFYREGFLITNGAMDYLKEEQPQHLVTIARPFAIGTYPTTRKEFAAFIAETGYKPDNGCSLAENNYRPSSTANWRSPGFIQSDTDPVVCINWYDAQAYIAWLNGKVSTKKLQDSDLDGNETLYRLPSEAEWEYAARAGTKTSRWWGNAIGKNNAVCEMCGSVWDAKRTAPVGSFRPNPFGLYDMLGNVLQWTTDCWNQRYFGAPLDGRPQNSGDCSKKVMRGGYWRAESWMVRSAARPRGLLDRRINDHGMRIAKTVT